MREPQRILITGANGYLGAQISLYLAEKGHLVTALCFPERPNDAHWCHLMHEVLVGSVAEPATIQLLQKRTFDTIIHLVSLDHHQSQNLPIEEVLKINVQPCWSLLNAFSDKGLQNFLFFSTIHVYGSLPHHHITEIQPVKPANHYALTHVLGEQICDYFNRTSSVHCMTVRLSNSYGQPIFPENNCWWLAVNDLCRTAYFEKSIKLLSNGSPQRDFIHGSDVCQAVELLLTKEVKPDSSSIFHISSGKTYTLLELAGIVRDVYQELFGVAIPVFTPDGLSVETFDLFSDQPRYSIRPENLSMLGFEPTVSIQEGIRQLFNYFEKHDINA